ncbi:MAG: hypothetical protein ABIQ59_12115 [Nocardioidaceae bacterium]
MTHPMTPEQEEQVRRALAATARAEDSINDGPNPPTMPADVAARLDGVLAELVQGRAGSVTAPGSAPHDHDELARHRSRRRLNVLVAAAAVAVIAAAGGAVVNGGLGGSGSSQDSTASSQAGSGQADDQAGPQPEAAGTPSASGSGSSSARSLAGVPALRSGTLAADVRRVVRTAPVAAAPNTLKDAQGADEAKCDQPLAPRGADVVDVRLDGDPATLVVDRATDGTREARVYSCSDGSTPVATTSVPRR